MLTDLEKAFKLIGEKVFGFFTKTKERSWIGHALQALIAVPLTALAVWFGWYSLVWGIWFFGLGFWYQREVIKDFLEKLPELGWKAAWAKFKDDNIGDMAYPMAVQTVILIVGLLLV